jgi:hypothetical protein
MRLERYKNKYLSVLNDDLLKFIVTFLDNHTIICLLTSGYDIHKRLCHKKEGYNRNNRNDRNENKYRNLFTSIAIQPTDDISDAIRHYLNHSKSIQRTVLYRMVEPNILWPFTTKEMVYVNCRFSNGEKYIDENAENEKKKKENKENESRITYRNY